MFRRLNCFVCSKRRYQMEKRMSFLGRGNTQTLNSTKTSLAHSLITWRVTVLSASSSSEKTWLDMVSFQLTLAPLTSKLTPLRMASFFRSGDKEQKRNVVGGTHE